jgi:hypothetical protein
MAYLLNLLYALLMLCGAPWLVVAAVRKGKYRTGWGAKLLGLVPPRVRVPCLAARGHEVSSSVAGGRNPPPASDWDIIAHHAHRLRTGAKRYAEHRVFYCP